MTDNYMECHSTVFPKSIVYFQTFNELNKTTALELNPGPLNFTFVFFLQIKFLLHDFHHALLSYCSLQLFLYQNVHNKVNYTRQVQNNQNNRIQNNQIQNNRPIRSNKRICLTHDNRYKTKGNTPQRPSPPLPQYITPSTYLPL